MKQPVTALNSSIPVPQRPQQRGSRVDDFIDRLSHPVRVKSTGTFYALGQCLISFGLLPLVLWPTRWAGFLDTERPDLLDLIAWWRRRSSSEDAALLDQLSRRLRPRPILMVLPWLVAGFNLVLLAMLYTNGDSWQRLWELTFQHRSPMTALEAPLYSAWITTLFLGYFCQWYAVRSHAVTVNELVKWTNRVGRDNQFKRIDSQVLKIGLNPLWIVVAVAFCGGHAWWAIPMTFAGAMQWRYIRRSSPGVRAALAGQARDSFAIADTGADRFCVANHCGARLPAPARYCPRCGTAV